MIVGSLNAIVLSGIPSELTPRESLLTPAIGAGLFVAFLLISIAKLLKSDIFISLLVSNIKVASLHGYIRDAHPLNKGGSVLLVFNYLMSFSLALYMLTLQSDWEFNRLPWMVGLLPFALLIWSVGCMFAVGLLTGERQVFTEVLEMKMVGAQLLGIVYFISVLVMALHPVAPSLYIGIVFWVFIAETLIRFYKSIRVVYLRRVSWYYIILYFCTLEILPLFVAYYLVMRVFGDSY